MRSTSHVALFCGAKALTPVGQNQRLRATFAASTAALCSCVLLQQSRKAGRYDVVLLRTSRHWVGHTHCAWSPERCGSVIFLRRTDLLRFSSKKAGSLRLGSSQLMTNATQVSASSRPATRRLLGTSGLAASLEFPFKFFRAEFLFLSWSDLVCRPSQLRVLRSRSLEFRSRIL